MIVREEESVSGSVSVIVPTFNERANVERIVTRCLDALTAFEVEVLVVDDDSPDRTWAVARDRFADDPRVRVVRRTEDKGLAQSVSAGFRRARNDYCVVIDADLQHPPEKIPELLAALRSGADVAVGSRHVDGGGIENWSRSRRFVSRGATALTRLGLPVARDIDDPMSGFFAVRQSKVADVELDPQGYKILLEVLVKCDCEEIVEVPYVFTERERGESKLDATQYQRFAEHLVSLSIASRGLSRYVAPRRGVRLAEFLGVGGVGTLVNMAVFTGLALGGQVHYLVAGVLAFVAAVNWNFAGNWAVTFDRPDGNLTEQYVQFNAVSVGGFLVYSALLAGQVQLLAVPEVAANLVAIVGASGFNFLGSESVAFDEAGLGTPGSATTDTTRSSGAD